MYIPDELGLSAVQDDNKRIYDTETRMREELHSRLEGMVLDVQQVISHRDNPENVPANMEIDEMYVLRVHGDTLVHCADACTASAKSSNLSLTNTKCANYNSTPCSGQKNLKCNTKSRNTNSRRSRRKWKPTKLVNSAVKCQHSPKLKAN